ncbi:MAG: ATPase domain-containing protein [Acidimicrobiia bacterium]
MQHQNLLLDELKAATLASYKPQTGETIRQGLEAIPTGIPALDDALVTGGFPTNHIVELFGEPAGGKTTLALAAAQNCQRLGGNVGYIDTEHSFPVGLAHNLGLDSKALLITQPDSGEDAVEQTLFMLTSKTFDLLIVDSVTALNPTRNVEHSRFVKQFLTKVADTITTSGCSVVLTNQTRATLRNPGATERSTGGNVTAYYTTIRIKLATSNMSGLYNPQQPAEQIGSRVEATIVKNRLGTPVTVEYGMAFQHAIFP